MGVTNNTYAQKAKTSKTSVLHSGWRQTASVPVSLLCFKTRVCTFPKEDHEDGSVPSFQQTAASVQMPFSANMRGAWRLIRCQSRCDSGVAPVRWLRSKYSVLRFPSAAQEDGSVPAPAIGRLQHQMRALRYVSSLLQSSAHLTEDCPIRQACSNYSMQTMRTAAFCKASCSDVALRNR